MSRLPTVLLVIAPLTLPLSACKAVEEREVLTGAGIGAAAGVATGAVTEADLVGAGLIGAALGAAAAAIIE